MLIFVPDLLPCQEKKLTSFHLVHFQIALDLTEDEKQKLENMEDVETRYNCLGVIFFCHTLGFTVHSSRVVNFIFSLNYLVIVNDN